MVEGDAETHLKLLSINAGFSFERGTELYGCTTYGKKEANSYENYRLPTKVQYTDPVTGATSFPFPFGFNPREGDRGARLFSHGRLAGLVGRVEMGFVQYVWRGQDSPVHAGFGQRRALCAHWHTNALELL